MHMIAPFSCSSWIICKGISRCLRLLVTRLERNMSDAPLLSPKIEIGWFRTAFIGVTIGVALCSKMPICLTNPRRHFRRWASVKYARTSPSDVDDAHISCFFVHQSTATVPIISMCPDTEWRLDFPGAKLRSTCLHKQWGTIILYLSSPIEFIDSNIEDNASGFCG